MGTVGDCSLDLHFGVAKPGGAADVGLTWWPSSAGPVERILLGHRLANCSNTSTRETGVPGIVSRGVDTNLLRLPPARLKRQESRQIELAVSLQEEEASVSDALEPQSVVCSSKSTCLCLPEAAGFVASMAPTSTPPTEHINAILQESK
jgi:hypothetical protein